MKNLYYLHAAEFVPKSRCFAKLRKCKARNTGKARVRRIEVNYGKLVNMFSARTRQLLEASGWNHNRDVDISAFLKFLEDSEYPIYPQVEAFLRQFGGLHIVYNTEWGNYLNFDLLDTSIWPQNIKQYSEQSDMTFCPIGDFDDGWNTIMMAPDGSIYVSYQGSIAFAGPDNEEAIEALMTGKQL